MRRKFGRRLQNGETPRLGFDVDFQVESYLQHQGASFLRRFDANSYLYLTRVMDYFDAFADPVTTSRALAGTSTRFLVVSFDSDWRFDTAHSARSCARCRPQVPVTFREITCRARLRSALLEVPEYHRTVAAPDRERGGKPMRPT
jgi:homoserine O-acetyltransferase